MHYGHFALLEIADEEFELLEVSDKVHRCISICSLKSL